MNSVDNIIADLLYRYLFGYILVLMIGLIQYNFFPGMDHDVYGHDRPGYTLNFKDGKKTYIPSVAAKKRYQVSVDVNKSDWNDEYKQWVNRNIMPVPMGETGGTEYLFKDGTDLFVKDSNPLKIVHVDMTKEEWMRKNSTKSNSTYPIHIQKYLAGVSFCSSIQEDTILKCLEIATDGAEANMLQLWKKTGHSLDSKVLEDWRKRRDDVCSDFIKERGYTGINAEITLNSCYIKNADELSLQLERN